MPLVGKGLQQLVVGGPDYGHHTLTRFFALHAGVLPALLVFFLVLHVALFRRHGICHKTPAKAPDAAFWPDQVLHDAVACLAVLAIVLLLCIHFNVLAAVRGGWSPASAGAELGAPADPSSPYSAARPEWYFLFLFQFLKLFEGMGHTGELLGAIVIPGRHASDPGARARSWAVGNGDIDSTSVSSCCCCLALQYLPARR